MAERNVKVGHSTLNLCVTAQTIFQITVKQIKYLTYIVVVEQDHRFITRITKPMMGFKAFHAAEATIAGNELHYMLKKNNIKMLIHNAFFSNFMD